MAHRSRLCGLIIDCMGEDVERSAEFWSSALGMRTVASTRPEDEGYRLLDAASRDLDIEVQQVSHPSGVHLDIETDDVEAEVSRLERLGAVRERRVRDWWIMRAPTGQAFCVVPAADAEAGAGWSDWP